MRRSSLQTHGLVRSRWKSSLRISWIRLHRRVDTAKKTSFQKTRPTRNQNQKKIRKLTKKRPRSEKSMIVSCFHSAWSSMRSMEIICHWSRLLNRWTSDLASHSSFISSFQCLQELFQILNKQKELALHELSASCSFLMRLSNSFITNN